MCGEAGAAGTEIENRGGAIDGDGAGAEDVAGAVGEGTGGDRGETGEGVGAAQGQGSAAGFRQGSGRSCARAGNGEIGPAGLHVVVLVVALVSVNARFVLAVAPV